MGYHTPLFDLAIIVSVPAENYAEACKIGKHIAAGLGDSEQLSVSLEQNFEYDDEGQRVLYLHAENEPYDQIETP